MTQILDDVKFFVYPVRICAPSSHTTAFGWLDNVGKTPRSSSDRRWLEYLWKDEEALWLSAQYVTIRRDIDKVANK
jgi:hypothetical protein